MNQTTPEGDSARTRRLDRHPPSHRIDLGAVHRHWLTNEERVDRTPLWGYLVAMGVSIAAWVGVYQLILWMWEGTQP